MKTIIITNEIIQEGKSRNGGWNKMQISALGEDQKNKGWLKRLIGKEVEENCVEKFMELKDLHFKNHPDKNYKIKKKNLPPSFQFVSSSIKWSDQYLHPNWQRMRLFILNRDNFTCINCKDKQKTLHVHHLKYPKNGFIWDVPHWYLVSLCEQCHQQEHLRDIKK